MIPNDIAVAMRAFERHSLGDHVRCSATERSSCEYLDANVRSAPRLILLDLKCRDWTVGLRYAS